jgi:hypothetical protein
MTEHPLTTRIRRILNMEDSSMKLTLTEGMGLLAAAFVGTICTLAAHGGPPRAVTDDMTRRALERLAASVVALPEGREGYIIKTSALVNVARAQLKLGDRAAFLATLRLLEGLDQPPLAKPGAKSDLRSCERFVSLVEVAQVRREAGDLDGARSSLARAAHDLEALDTRGAFDRMGKEIDTALAQEADGPRRLHDEEAGLISEAAIGLIDEYIALGDTAQARTQIRSALDAVGPAQGPTKAMLIGALGSYLVKAGDPDGGRDLIKRTRQAALAVSDLEAREFAVQNVAHSLFAAGDVDEALGLLRELTPHAQHDALEQILGELTVNDPSFPAYDVADFTAGINILIGEPWLRLKDPASARTALPKITAVVRASHNAELQARTLAFVAHLQARANDIPGALATARSIPDLKRSDFPEPSDGFYDAVKPAALALVAGVMAEAGDQSGATAALREAEALARAVQAEDQKLIAQIVIAKKYAACGQRAAAQAVVNEAVPLALAQAEPRRSRMLTMLAEAQVKAGDPAGALRTIDAIREYPGLEKTRALAILANSYEETGDAATSEMLFQRAIACLEKKAPDTPLPGKILAARGFSIARFVDFDLEVEPKLVKFERETKLQGFRTRIGDVDVAVREAKALPPEQRGAALSQIAGSLVHRGDIDAAMNLAASIESPDARLQAFAALAAAVPDHRTRK